MGLKNIEKAQVLRLGDEVEYQQGQIVSKTLAQNRALSMTLFAFEQDEEISTHTADGDALVTVLDGTGRFTIDGEAHLVSAGESIIMPARMPIVPPLAAVAELPSIGLVIINRPPLWR